MRGTISAFLYRTLPCSVGMFAENTFKHHKRLILHQERVICKVKVTCLTPFPLRVHTSARVRISHSVQTRLDALKTHRYLLSPAGPECSRNFTAPRGVVKTPGFPEKYPNNLDCTFMIFAPKMSEIVVEFDSFDMEPDTTPPPGALCRYDWLEIWDGFPAGEEKEEGFGSG